MKRIILATFVGSALVLSAGCESGAKQASQRDASKAAWNNARAGVLGSLAQDQFKNGDLVRAEKTIGDAISLEPTSPALRIIAARIGIEQGRLEVARAQLNDARNLLIAAQEPAGKSRDRTEPAPIDDAEINYLLGVIAQRWQRHEEALELYQAASVRRPDDLAYLLATAEQHVTVGRPDEAMRLLADRVVYFDTSPAIRDALGQLYEQSGRIDDAIDAYRQASVLDPTDESIRVRLTRALYQRGRSSEALSQAERLLQSDISDYRFELLLLVAECRLKLGQIPESRDAFEQASRIDSTHIGAWRGIARASIEQGDLRRASLALSKAEALGPNEPLTHMMIGLLRIQQGDHVGAMQAFRRASELDSTDPLARTMMGWIHQRAGRSEEAVRFYGEALVADPKDALARRLLADVGH
jgi:tetratricopeptide (TPR) repeat protein